MSDDLRTAFRRIHQAFVFSHFTCPAIHFGAIYNGLSSMTVVVHRLCKTDQVALFEGTTSLIMEIYDFHHFAVLAFLKFNRVFWVVAKAQGWPYP